MPSNPFTAPARSSHTDRSLLPKIMRITLGATTMVYGLSCGFFTTFSVLMLTQAPHDTLLMGAATNSLENGLAVTTALAILLHIPAGFVALLRKNWAPWMLFVACLAVIVAEFASTGVWVARRGHLDVALISAVPFIAWPTLCSVGALVLMAIERSSALSENASE